MFRVRFDSALFWVFLFSSSLSLRCTQKERERERERKIKRSSLSYIGCFFDVRTGVIRNK